MPLKYKRKTNKSKKKKFVFMKKKYQKPKISMFKVPKMKVVGLKREQWLDLNFTTPGGHSWVNGRVKTEITNETPVLNMHLNTVDTDYDPANCRVNWQPIFTFKQLPDLSDVSGLFRLFKINKISMTLYPMRATNPTQTAGATPQQNPIAPNILITTMYAKSGMDNRIGYGTQDFAQVQNKSTKLYNLGIGTKKIGWYFKPVVQDITYKNPQSLDIQAFG